jgi:hypothetical protein
MRRGRDRETSTEEERNAGREAVTTQTTILPARMTTPEALDATLLVVLHQGRRMQPRSMMRTKTQGTSICA